jgi:hypothetical protein
MRRVLLCPFGCNKKNNALVAFSLSNAVEQEEQDSLAPVEQDSLVPVEAAEKFLAGLV